MSRIETKEFRIETEDGYIFGTLDSAACAADYFLYSVINDDDIDDFRSDIRRSKKSPAMYFFGVHGRTKALNLAEIVIKPGRRGRGAGRRLVEQAEEWGRAQGAVFAYLWGGTLDESFGPSKGFWGRMGYQFAWEAPYGDVAAYKRIGR